MTDDGDDHNNTKNKFIASSTWNGSKPGYYFGTGQFGTGYYLDDNDNRKPKPDDQEEDKTTMKNENTTTTNNKKRVGSAGGVRFAEEKNEMRLLREAEQQASSSGAYVMELTPKGIQSATNALSRIYQKNSMARGRHADDPHQYMESEIQLYDQLSALQAIGAGDSKLYQHVLDTSDLMPLLIQLLGHENTDISACVVALLYQLIDPSNVDDDDDPDCLPVMSRLSSIVLKEAWETIVSNLYQFQDQQQRERQQAGGEEGQNGQQEEQRTLLSIDELATTDPNLKGVENTLSLMENLLELDALMAPEGGILSGHDDDGNSELSAAAYMVRESSILSWLFQQIEVPPPAASSSPSYSDLTLIASKEEEFKGRCMEMIAFIAQNSDVFDVQPDWNALPRVNTNSSKDDSTKAPPSKKQKNDDSSPPPPPSKFIEGVDIFLQSIGRYRKKQPSNDQQIEYLENACIALSSCIMFSTINLKHFVDLEGIPLVMYCEKNNVYSGCSALRLLDFSMEGDVPKRAAEEIVTSGLLKYLFPLFLGTRTPKPAIPLKNAKAKRSWLHDIKTRTIRILYGLSLHLDHTSPEDGQERFISKFVEDNLKNCDRLVELLLEFDEKARKAEYKVFRSDIDESIGEEQVALTAFDAKLKAGGDMCHRLAAIAAYVCAHSKRCHGRIISQLKLQQAGVSLLKESLTEFGSSLRPGKQQDHINGLIKQI